jgi:hypothetical protein
MSKQTVRLEDLVGARVKSLDGVSVGHIQEIVAERHGGELQLMEYHLGTGALLERWSLTRHLFGLKGHRLIVRWHQIDIGHRNGPRLLVPVEEVEKRTV